MTEAQQTTVPVTVLGKTFSIKCAMNEVQALQESVAYLQKRLNAVQDPNSESNRERVVIITALNLVHEIMYSNDEEPTSFALNQRLTSLTHKVENALTRQCDTASENCEE